MAAKPIWRMHIEDMQGRFRLGQKEPCMSPIAHVPNSGSGKKFPPRWLYVPSRREISGLLKTVPADVRRVEFAGTGGRSPLMGYLERRVVDGAWCFYLRLWGLRESEVGKHRDELAQAALGAIRNSVTECLATPPSAVIKPK